MKDDTITLISPARPEGVGVPLSALLGEAGFSEVSSPVAAWVEIYADTPTGRLFRRGWRLRHDSRRKGWILKRRRRPEKRQAGPVSSPPRSGPVGKRLEPVCAGHNLVPILVVRTRERWFVPAAPVSSPATENALPPAVRLRELRVSDPFGDREKDGPRLVILPTVPGEAASRSLPGFLLGHVPGATASPPDLLAEGLAVLGLPLPGVPTPPSLRVAAEDLAPVAAKKILQHQVQLLRTYRRGAVLDLDPEYVHQIRVATRRARAALRVFGRWLEPSEAVPVNRQLREVGRGLGPVRDMDILLATLSRDLGRVHAAPEVREKIENAFRRRRSAALDAAKRFLESDGFEQMALRLERLPALAERAAPTLAEVALPLLVRAVKKVGRWRKRKSGVFTETELHRIRIAIKKLRYLGEFLSPLGAEGIQTAIRGLVPYQDCLGEMQDARVAVKYLRAEAEVRCADRSPDVEEIFVLGELVRGQEKRKRKRQRRFRRLWARFPRRGRRLRKALAQGLRRAG